MKPKLKPHDDPACPCAGCARFAGITRDPVSGMLLPANAEEWQRVLELVGVVLPKPDHVWTFVDTSELPPMPTDDQIKAFLESKGWKVGWV